MLAHLFAPGRRRRAAAEERLALAYRRTFAGEGSPEDARLVLADLANHTGFYRVNDHGTPADDRAFSDGKRAAFGRIFRFLRLSGEELVRLEEQARLEAVTDAMEGEF